MTQKLKSQVIENCPDCGGENVTDTKTCKCEHCNCLVVACHACSAWVQEFPDRCGHCGENGSLFIEYDK